MHRQHRLLLTLLVASVSICSLHATAAVDLIVDKGAPITPPRLSQSDLSIRIDGRLDESEWLQAAVFDDFRLVDPDTLERPRWPTTARFLYTDKGLYVGFDNVQPPDTVVSVLSPRDTGTSHGDFVGFTIDPTGEGKYGYWMSLAASGVKTDGTLIPESQFSRDWDGAWQGNAVITDTGWQAEMFIPWSLMAMPATEESRSVSIFLSRKVASIGERWGAPGLPFTIAKWIGNMKPMTIEGINPRQQWSVIPYTSVTQDKVRDNTSTNVGAEVFWRPSTNFQVSASLLPDFGNVESDDVVVNLSALEAFFPERRLFFLEGRDIFITTPRADPTRNPTPVTIVNTRRIGGAPRLPSLANGQSLPLSESTRPMELHAAAKVTGTLGGLRYGFLAASEDDIEFTTSTGPIRQSGSDYGIARVFWEDSSTGTYRAIGAISTSTLHPDEDAYVNGLDAHYLSSNGRWKLDSQLMHSRKENLGNGLGAYTDIVYNPKQGLNYKLGLSHYDDKLDINGLGFLSRNDITTIQFGIDRNISNLSSIRQFNYFFNSVYEVNGERDVTRQGFFTRAKFDLNNLHRVQMTLAFFGRRTDDLESFGNGDFIIPSRWESSFEYKSNQAKRLGWTLGLGVDQEKIDGLELTATIGLAWRPIPRFRLEAEAQYIRRGGWLLHQEDRNFTTFKTHEWRPSLSADYFFSPKQQLRLSAQWVAIRAGEKDFYQIGADAGELTNVTKPLGPSDDFAISNFNVQLRYRWEMAPLSDLFLVYTLSGLDNTPNAAFADLFENTYDRPFREQITLKFRYRFGN